MQNPLTPAGIEPATFRFVAQHLNHCATAVLQEINVLRKTVHQFGFIYKIINVISAFDFLSENKAIK